MEIFIYGNKGSSKGTNNLTVYFPVTAENT